ncbi:MAG: hypothetical protein AAGH57_05650 [Pseudomonadota bacterium]
MEYTIALGVWAVSVAAPCVVCWLAGDMVGSARTRRQHEEGLGPRIGETGVDSALLVEEWRLDPSPASAPLGSRRWESFAPPSRGVSGDEATFEEQAREAERRRLRREAFAAIPALSDLRAHADAIIRRDGALVRGEREDTLLGERKAERALSHYESSVRELHRSKSGLRASRSTSALGENGARERAQGHGSRVARAG